MMCVCTCSNAKVLTKLVHQCYVYSTSLPDSLTTVRNTGIRKSGNKGILCMGICFQTMPGVLGIYYLLGINTEHGVHVPCNNDLRAIQHNSSVWSSLLHIQSNLLPQSLFYLLQNITHLNAIHITPNGVLTAHTVWLPGVVSAPPMQYIQTLCRGCGFKISNHYSCCHGNTNFI